MNDSKIIEEMYAYIDLALQVFYDKHLENHAKPDVQLARETGCCLSTIRKLMAHTTRFPRYLTLKKFGDACGLHLVWTKAGQPRLKMAG